MSRSNRSRDATVKNSNEGTAARTRPVSLEEIMLRREEKSSADVKRGASEIRDPFEDDDANGALSDKRLKNKKGYKDRVEGNSKRLVNKDRVEGNSKRLGDKDRVEGSLQKLEEMDTAKRNSNRLEEAISKTEKEHSEGNMNLRTSHNKSSRNEERMNVKESHHRSKASKQLGADSEKVSQTKHIKVSVEKDKQEERDKKLGPEGKRKHGSRIDDKRRSIIDDSNFKNHDSDRRDRMIDDKRRSAIDNSSLKKHGSDRKDWKKEHTQTHKEEPRAKRRRSRDRSASVSPREHRHPYDGRDCDEPSFESFKDKSRRKYSDHDSYKTQGNSGYNSGHYWKHGSGLGGYSPRKRRTEAAVKTPSPPKRATERKRSPERKSSTWDQPPISGSIHMNFQSIASKTFEANTVAAVKAQPVPSFDTAPMMINAAVDSVQLTQATRPKRRLYIENLPPSISETTVIDCLNDYLLSSGINRIQGAKPCISCIINKEKSQAVVEFLTPEDASSAISFDGRSLLGSVLKIRRPKDFVEAPIRAPEKTVTEKKVPTVKVLSGVVKDSPHKIFIGGISKALSSDTLLELVRAFGILKAYHFEFNKELNGSCAFLEYEDHSLTQKACAGLNGMKLGGLVITAVHAFLDSHGEEDNAENLPSYDIPLHAKSLLVESTRVLQLKNVFIPEEFQLLSESEVEETLEDVRLECTRFGTVKSINVVRFNSKHTSMCEDATEGPEQQDAHTHYDSTMIRSRASSSSDNCKNGDVNMATLVDERELQNVTDDTDHADSSIENPVKENESYESANPDGSQLEFFSDLGDRMHTVPLDIPLDVDVRSKKVADPEVHPSNGDNEKILLENTDSNILVAEKDNVDNGDGNHQTPEHSAFEPGCVLVEFLR